MGHEARSRLATGLAGLSVAACLAWATDARAAACCGEASALGDRLSAAEVTAISTSLSGRGRIGSFDEDGEYFPASIDDIDVRFQLAADAALRVSSWLEVGATVPVVVNLRGSDGHAEAGGSFGDVTGTRPGVDRVERPAPVRARSLGPRRRRRPHWGARERLDRQPPRRRHRPR
jgi:hypothetical protein